MKQRCLSWAEEFDIHTNYMSLFSISANTGSKACISFLGCGTLDFCPAIDYVDPRHKCTLRAAPQTRGTMVLLLPSFTTPRETFIMASGSIIALHDNEAPGDIHGFPELQVSKQHVSNNGRNKICDLKI
jgi:hypothetical protein